MSNRPGNRATKKRTPPTPPGASPPHQRRRKPSPELSEAPGNSNETSGPAWVELLHSPISDAIGKLAGHDDLFSSPQRVTGAVAHPAQALFNTLSNRPDAFIGDEWAATLEDLHAVLFRGLQTIDRVLQLTYPTSHVQEPPLPSPEPNDPSKVVLAAISDLRSSLEARLSKLEDSPSPPTTPPSPTRQSRSYAEVSDSAHPSSPSSRHDETTAQPKGPAQPTLPRDQLRYVVNYQGDTPPREQQHSPQVLRSLLRAAASLCALSSQVQFLGSHWNKTGNLILTFSPSTSPSAVDALLPHIRAALTLSADTPITRVVPWSRLVVSSAPARPSPNAPVYSSEAVLDDLVVSNPVFGNVTVTRKPTWVRKPELIQSASSFAISFEDPDGSIARQLLKRHIFLFGAPVTVKRWSNRPRPVTA